LLTRGVPHSAVAVEARVDVRVVDAGAAKLRLSRRARRRAAGADGHVRAHELRRLDLAVVVPAERPEFGDRRNVYVQLQTFPSVSFHREKDSEAVLGVWLPAPADVASAA